MGWVCLECGAKLKGNSLWSVFEHELETGHTRIEPDKDTAKIWGKALGYL